MSETQLEKHDLEQHMLLHLQAEDHCQEVTQITIVAVEDDQDWPYKWKVLTTRGSASEQAIHAGMKNVYRKLGNIAVKG